LATRAKSTLSRSWPKERSASRLRAPGPAPAGAIAGRAGTSREGEAALDLNLEFAAEPVEACLESCLVALVEESAQAQDQALELVLIDLVGAAEVVEHLIAGHPGVGIADLLGKSNWSEAFLLEAEESVRRGAS
jgi:hypothetical protein